MLIRNDPAIRIKELFMEAGLGSSLSSFFSTLAVVVNVLLLSWLLNLISKTTILKIVTRNVEKTSSTWYDLLALSIIKNTI